VAGNSASRIELPMIRSALTAEIMGDALIPSSAAELSRP
jgi:hypothetical protein